MRPFTRYSLVIAAAPPAAVAGSAGLSILGTTPGSFPAVATSDAMFTTYTKHVTA
jgi:hypothetical protein